MKSMEDATGLPSGGGIKNRGVFQNTPRLGFRI